MALPVNAKDGDGLKHETVNLIGSITNSTGDQIGLASADITKARNDLTPVQSLNNTNQSDLQNINTTMATMATQRSNEQSAISSAKARLDVLERATPPPPTNAPPPDAPTGLTALPSGITTNSIVLSWTPAATGAAATGFQTQYAVSAVTPPPATKVESQHDTTVTNTSGQIVDASLNVWTLVPSGGATAPAPASAAGYTVQVFGPNMSLGNNWRKWASDVNATQNSDGSITTTGGNNNYGLNVVTALPTGGANWTGSTWTGGAYFEWTMSFTGTPNPGSIANGWPSLFLADIEGPGFTDGSLAHWQGQASDYYRWATINVAEWANDHTPMSNAHAIYHEFSDFYSTVGSNVQVETGYNANGSPFISPTSYDLTRQHKYGFLWVPATASTPGYARYFIDDARVDTGVAVWNNYNPATNPPPVKGTTAFSFIDARHILAGFGTGPQNPLTVSAFSVWQSSGTGSASGLQIAIDGKVQTSTSNVVLMKYYNPGGAAKAGTTKHSVAYKDAAGTWFMSTGVTNDVATWTQLTGDPDVADTPPPPPPPTGGPGTGPAFRLPAGNRTIIGGQRVSVNMNITDNQPGWPGRLLHGIKPYFYSGIWRNAEGGQGFFSGGTTVGWLEQGVYLYDDDIARIYSVNGLPAIWDGAYPINGSRLGARFWTYGTAASRGVDLQLFTEPGLDDAPQYDVIVDYKGPNRGDTFRTTPNVFGAGRCVDTSWGSYYDLTQDGRGPAGYGLGWIAFPNYKMTMDQIGNLGGF